MLNSNEIVTCLTDLQFQATLVLFANDCPTKLGRLENIAMRELLNNEARLRGKRDWIEAFNSLKKKA